MPTKVTKSLPTIRPTSVVTGTASKAAPKIGASVPGSGDGFVPLAQANVTKTSFVIPSKNFSYAVPGHGTMSFFNGEPKEVTPGIYSQLNALNGTPAKATQTVTVGGTYAAGDIFTVILAGNDITYIAVSGDTTPTLLATHLIAAINATVPNLVVATNVAGVITLTATYNGVTPNTYSLKVYKRSTSGTIVAGGAALVGGVDGRFFN